MTRLSTSKVIELSVTNGRGYDPQRNSLPVNSKNTLRAYLTYLEFGKNCVRGLEPSGFLFSSSGIQMDLYFVEKEKYELLAEDNLLEEKIAHLVDLQKAG